MNVESFPLPNELTFEIFRFLDIKNLIVASKVCKKWQKIANDDCLWKFFLDRTKYLPPCKDSDPYFWKNLAIKSQLGLFKLNLNHRFLSFCNETLINSLPQIKEAKNLCHSGLPLAIISPESCVMNLEFLRMDEERNLAIFLSNHKFIFMDTENKIVQEIPIPVLAPARFCLIKNWAIFIGRKNRDTKRVYCYALNLKTGHVTRLIKNKKTEETDSPQKSNNSSINLYSFEEAGPYLSCKIGESSLAFWKMNPNSQCEAPVTILDGFGGETNYFNVYNSCYAAAGAAA